MLSLSFSFLSYQKHISRITQTTSKRTSRLSLHLRSNVIGSFSALWRSSLHLRTHRATTRRFLNAAACVRHLPPFSSRMFGSSRFTRITFRVGTRAAHLVHFVRLRARYSGCRALRAALPAHGACTTLVLLRSINSTIVSAAILAPPRYSFSAHHMLSSRSRFPCAAAGIFWLLRSFRFVLHLGLDSLRFLFWFSANLVGIPAFGSLSPRSAPLFSCLLPSPLHCALLISTCSWKSVTAVYWFYLLRLFTLRPRQTLPLTRFSRAALRRTLSCHRKMDMAAWRQVSAPLHTSTHPPPALSTPHLRAPSSPPRTGGRVCLTPHYCGGWRRRGQARQRAVILQAQREHPPSMVWRKHGGGGDENMRAAGISLFYVAVEYVANARLASAPAARSTAFSLLPSPYRTTSAHLSALSQVLPQHRHHFQRA